MKFRATVPDVVKKHAGGERRLAWGLTSGGEPVVATPDALHLPGVVLPWWQVERAVWKDPHLEVREVAEVEGTGRLHVLDVPEQERLAEVVHTQVTGSVAWSDRRALSPGGHVRVVGRRQPGRDPLLWQLVYAPGTDTTDPLVRAQAEQLVEGLRRTLG